MTLAVGRWMEWAEGEAQGNLGFRNQEAPQPSFQKARVT